MNEFTLSKYTPVLLFTGRHIVIVFSKNFFMILSFLYFPISLSIKLLILNILAVSLRRIFATTVVEPLTALKLLVREYISRVSNQAYIVLNNLEFTILI